jgi:hypothetical protein
MLLRRLASGDGNPADGQRREKFPLSPTLHLADRAEYNLSSPLWRLLPRRRMG